MELQKNLQTELLTGEVSLSPRGDAVTPWLGLSQLLENGPIATLGAVNRYEIIERSVQRCHVFFPNNFLYIYINGFR